MQLDQTVFELIQTGAGWWAQRKLELGVASGLSPDALHLQAGIITLCLAAIIMRRDPISIGPWLILLVFECFNELADLMLDGMGSTEATLGAGLHDFVNTLFAPTLLLAVKALHTKRRTAQEAMGSAALKHDV